MLNKFARLFGMMIAMCFVTFGVAYVTLVALPPMFSAANTLTNLAGVGVVVLLISLLAAAAVIVTKLESKNDA